MKVYEQIQDLEHKIFRAKEQAAFLKHQLNSVDKAIALKKQKLEEDIAAYNIRTKRDQEILSEHKKNIESWNKKLQELLAQQIKKLDKKEEEPLEEKSEEEIEKEELKAKKAELERELNEMTEKLEKSSDKKKKKAPIGEPIPITEEELDDVIEDRKLASNELKEFADKLNGETVQIEWLKEHHQDWIKQYSDEEGGQAIWRGVITKGFKAWCDEKDYIIGF
jgi:chromosome segregation ATPase